jgi:hypothetical protein
MLDGQVGDPTHVEEELGEYLCPARNVDRLHFPIRVTRQSLWNAAARAFDEQETKVADHQIAASASSLRMAHTKGSAIAASASSIGMAYTKGFCHSRRLTNINSP